MWGNLLAVLLGGLLTLLGLYATDYLNHARRRNERERGDLERLQEALYRLLRGADVLRQEQWVEKRPNGALLAEEGFRVAHMEVWEASAEIHMLRVRVSKEIREAVIPFRNEATRSLLDESALQPNMNEYQRLFRELQDMIGDRIQAL